MKVASLVAFLSLAHSTYGQEPATGARKRSIRVLVNGLYSPTGIDFDETSTFPSFLEEGRSDRSYDGGKGIAFEAGAIVGIREGLGIMGTFEIYQTELEGVFEDVFPHPLYFEQPRTVTGEIQDLD
jgi:hypothetical protein